MQERRDKATEFVEKFQKEKNPEKAQSLWKKIMLMFAGLGEGKDVVATDERPRANRSLGHGPYDDGE